MNKINKKKLQQILMKLVKNEIRVIYHKSDESIPMYNSKLGGKPAVPEDFEWPKFTGESCDGIIKNRHLAFMAQINLKESSIYDTEQILPKTGILSFFYEYVSSPWGFEPEHKGCARVYYFSDEKDLVLMDIPKEMEDESIMPELAITFEKHISIPIFTDFEKKDTGLYFELDWDEYDECRSEYDFNENEWGEVTKLLGYPDTIQSPMEEECEVVTRGYGSYDEIPEMEKKDIEEKSDEWMLLFQIGEIKIDDSPYMYGDCGHLYFWIKKYDLMNLNFDSTWLILQCG